MYKICANIYTFADLKLKTINERPCSIMNDLSKQIKNYILLQNGIYLNCRIFRILCVNLSIKNKKTIVILDEVKIFGYLVGIICASIGEPNNKST